VKIMLQDIESDPIESEPVLETDAAPAAQPAQPTKPASLTGSLVQRGRDRAPRIPQVPVPASVVTAPAPAPEAPPAAEFAPVSDEVPLVFAKTPRKAAPEAEAPGESRWSEALFVAACCAAFFATFLFVLRF
jgi:hypothetical protein